MPRVGGIERCAARIHTGQYAAAPSLAVRPLKDRAITSVAKRPAIAERIRTAASPRLDVIDGPSRHAAMDAAIGVQAEPRGPKPPPVTT